MIGAINSKSRPLMLSAVRQREEEAGKRGRSQALGVLQARPVHEDSCALSSYYMPSPVLGARDGRVEVINVTLAFLKFRL